MSWWCNLGNGDMENHPLDLFQLSCTCISNIHTANIVLKSVADITWWTSPGPLREFRTASDECAQGLGTRLDRHTRGQSIADSKVHVQVICCIKTYRFAWMCVYNYIFNCITGGRRSIPSGLQWFKSAVQCGDTIIHMSKLFATLYGKGVLLPVLTDDFVHLLWFPAWSSV